MMNEGATRDLGKRQFLSSPNSLNPLNLLSSKGPHKLKKFNLPLLLWKHYLTV